MSHNKKRLPLELLSTYIVFHLISFHRLMCSGVEFVSFIPYLKTMPAEINRYAQINC